MQPLVALEKRARMLCMMMMRCGKNSARVGYSSVVLSAERQFLRRAS